MTATTRDLIAPLRRALLKSASYRRLLRIARPPLARLLGLRDRLIPYFAPRNYFIQVDNRTDVAGMFTVFNFVLGCLDFYDRHRCQGIRVDFGQSGLYYDPRIGDNWWNYYFEPILRGQARGARILRMSNPRHFGFLWRGQEERTFDRIRSSALIHKYVRIRPPILEKVEAFAHRHFADHFVVGIHYRGTDKSLETPRTPYERVHQSLKQVLAGVEGGRSKIFVATDEEPFLDELLRRFATPIVFIDAMRSRDGEPVHRSHGANYQKGEEALMDCLLLSRCDVLIRTPSSLSHCAVFFNTQLPVINLSNHDVIG